MWKSLFLLPKDFNMVQNFHYCVFDLEMTGRVPYFSYNYYRRFLISLKTRLSLTRTLVSSKDVPCFGLKVQG